MRVPEGRDHSLAGGAAAEDRSRGRVRAWRDIDVDNSRLWLTSSARRAFVMPALEIVGSRINKWDISIVDTIADNASSGLFVIGKDPSAVLKGLDLREVSMQMTRGGEVVSEGKGAACLDNPLNAVAWLAGELASRGRPLRAGDIVLSGALGPMVSVAPGDRFVASISEIGTVSAVFADS